MLLFNYECVSKVKAVYSIYNTKRENNETLICLGTINIIVGWIDMTSNVFKRIFSLKNAQYNAYHSLCNVTIIKCYNNNSTQGVGSRFIWLGGGGRG